MKFHFSVTDSPTDPERLVLPGIVFVSGGHHKVADPEITGFVIAAGWWRWGVRFAATWKKP